MGNPFEGKRGGVRARLDCSAHARIQPRDHAPARSIYCPRSWLARPAGPRCLHLRILCSATSAVDGFDCAAFRRNRHGGATVSLRAAAGAEFHAADGGAGGRAHRPRAFVGGQRDRRAACFGNQHAAAAAADWIRGLRDGVHHAADDFLAQPRFAARLARTGRRFALLASTVCRAAPGVRRALSAFRIIRARRGSRRHSLARCVSGVHRGSARLGDHHCRKCNDHFHTGRRRRKRAAGPAPGKWQHT